MHKKHPNLKLIFLVSVLLGFLLATGCKKAETGLAPPLTPQEALASFHLADDNLTIALVASEPLVQDPVAIAFDEAGRLWVAEMLGFMQDIDGIGEKDKIGRISVLFDDDQDGTMDRSLVFADSLILPRALAVVDGGALVAENMPLWFMEDTNGDFIADKKTLIDSLYGGLGVPEHSANGLWRGMDNWFYNAKSKYRYKKNNEKWVRDETEFRGQWGISHDDAGRLFYNYNWSQLHADLVPPNALMANLNHSATSGIDHGLTLNRKIFPIRSNTAVNRGYVPGTLDAQERLIEFASACGPLVFRGTALPHGYRGNAFVCEPTSNLIKQNTVFEDGFMLRAEAVYSDKEFLASLDERFRPISLASGPDGALYVVDMYKGIIQHAPYMTPYLREETLKRGLDKPIHMGRIWRISDKKNKKTPLEDLSGLPHTALIAKLQDPNGWTRDTAQRLLVEKGDRSIIPQLENLVLTGNGLGKLHALWVLEGLQNDQPRIYLSALMAEDPKVVQAALRLASAAAQEHPEVSKSLESFIQNNYASAAPLVKMQMVLASRVLDEIVALAVSSRFLNEFGQFPIARDVVLSQLAGREEAMLNQLLSETKAQAYDQGREIFVEMLATAIVNSDTTKRQWISQITESISDNENAWFKNALLNGMANAKSDFKLNSSLSLNVDAALISAGRQKYLNICASCHGTQGEGLKRFAPPLQNSAWVIGDGNKLAMILLHGMQGPVEVNGKLYDVPDILPEMPAFTTLQNEDIAAIATYIRNSWGHSANEVTASTVGGIRFRTQGKINPWTAKELDTLIFDDKR